MYLVFFILNKELNTKGTKKDTTAFCNSAKETIQQVNLKYSIKRCYYYFRAFASYW